MKKFLFPVLAAVCLLVNISYSQAQTALKPVKVEVRMVDSSYQLIRDGKPYFVKGAGGSRYLGRVAAYGGNSIRTWSTKDGQQILDSAQKYGLTVLMGLGLTPERHNFDYNDTALVRQQFDRVKAEVLKSGITLHY